MIFQNIAWGNSIISPPPNVEYRNCTTCLLECSKSGLIHVIIMSNCNNNADNNIKFRRFMELLSYESTHCQIALIVPRLPNLFSTCGLGTTLRLLSDTCACNGEMLWHSYMEKAWLSRASTIIKLKLKITYNRKKYFFSI